MPDRYSVIVSPPEAIATMVKQVKQLLYQSIGDYPSFEDEAHITICIFDGNEQTLQNWCRFIEIFVQQKAALTLSFSRVVCFSNGALVILPDDASKEVLVDFMKSFYINTPAPYYGKSKAPHITIARRLNKERMLAAKTAIEAVDLDFILDILTVKRFNKEKGSYEVYRRFQVGKND